MRLSPLEIDGEPYMAFPYRSGGPTLRVEEEPLELVDTVRSNEQPVRPPREEARPELSSVG
jgi:hypothetical protein